MAHTPAPAEWIDSRHAVHRLLLTLVITTLGCSPMYVVSVVLPAVQAEFGVGRADASLPYTVMMVCFGLGGIAMGRLADRIGIQKVLWLGSVAIVLGFVAAGMAPNIWLFIVAHGLLLGLLGSSTTFAPLLADTSLWWDKRRGVAVAVCASGNYLAGSIWPTLTQWGVEQWGWRTA